ncbi:MAG TPA: response regulator [Acidimicrobiales bacterium]|nr:response regulator [Acidimicrobiales bacterium]
MQGADVDVLAVEDDENVRHCFVSALRGAGYSVAEADDGFVALELLRSLRVGAMVLDVRMPVMDGFQLLDRLDEPPPTVLVSAQPYDAEAMARREKVHAYLQKPVRTGELLAAVRSALETGPWGSTAAFGGS